MSAAPTRVAPLTVDFCGGQSGLVLTPDLHAPWDEAPFVVEGTLTLLWCGEGTVHLDDLISQWGEERGVRFEQVLDVDLAPGIPHRSPLRGSMEFEGEVVVRGHHGDVPLRASTFVIVGEPVPPSEGARRCHEGGGHLRTDGLLGSERCDLPTTDHSASCSTDAECDGVCIGERFEARSNRACPAGLTNYVMVGHCSEGTLGPTCRIPMHELVQICATEETLTPPTERCE